MFEIKLEKSTKEIRPKQPVLLVTGDGRTLDSDVATFMSWDIAHDLACIGRCVKKFDHVDHWLNADGETAIAWVKQIKTNGMVTHTLGAVDGFDADWTVSQPNYKYKEITNDANRFHGSSALFAAMAGVEMGYDQVWLAGCPMDQEGHWYFEPNKPETLGPMWMGMDYMAWIDFAQTREAAKVRSLSGYTAKILGDI